MVQRTAVVVLLVAALGGCGGGRGGGGDGDGRAGYPKDIESNFLTSCKANGGSASRCQCVLDKLESTLSLKDFKREEAALRAGAKPPRKLTDAIADCS